MKLKIEQVFQSVLTVSDGEDFDPIDHHV